MTKSEITEAIERAKNEDRPVPGTVRGVCYVTVAGQTACGDDMTPSACRRAAEKTGGTAEFRPKERCR